MGCLQVASGPSAELVKPETLNHTIICSIIWVLGSGVNMQQLSPPRSLSGHGWVPIQARLLHGDILEASDVAKQSR